MAAAELLILSPHLDDGVLSLGAFIATATAAGALVTVVTIFGGNPGSTAAAGRWDGRAGFDTAGAASRGRRNEDRHACHLLGAACEWLPFLDGDYGPPPAEAVVWDRLRSRIDAADHVFVPGRPLIHRDHAWVSRLVSERADPEKLVFYAELPYDAWPEDRRQGQDALAEPARAREWSAPRTTVSARFRKWRATAAYSTQLAWLARPGYRLAVWQTRFGRERLAWPSSPAAGG
jgi:LmbE family N-acetylglucosaminyl deacetylase